MVRRASLERKRPGDEEMRKEEVRREDGRYLIYYWFDDEPVEDDEAEVSEDTPARSRDQE